jgi:hypothetical protein
MCERDNRNDGKSLGSNPHAVRWAGVVVEKLTFEDYWSDRRFKVKRPDFSSTPDNIYRPAASGFEQVKNWRTVRSKPKRISAGDLFWRCRRRGISESTRRSCRRPLVCG